MNPFGKDEIVSNSDIFAQGKPNSQYCGPGHKDGDRVAGKAPVLVSDIRVLDDKSIDAVRTHEITVEYFQNRLGCNWAKVRSERSRGGDQYRPDHPDLHDRFQE